MQTSRFQLGLMATLAVGLGFSLASPQAIGYPAASAVSLGSNPMVSRGGELDATDSATPLVAPSDQDLVITDVILSAIDSSSGCFSNAVVIIQDDTDVLAQFAVGISRSSSSLSRYDPIVLGKLSSGIVIPAGNTLTISSERQYESSCSSGEMAIEYTLSGYYAQP